VQDTRVEDPFTDPRHDESDAPVTSSRSRSHGRFGLQTPTESPMLGQPAGHVPQTERQRGRGPFSPPTGQRAPVSPSVDPAPVDSLLFDATEEEANSTLPRLQVAPGIVASTTLKSDTDADAEAVALALAEQSRSPSPVRSPFSPSTKTLNRRSVITDYTVASTTRQTRTSMTPSLLRTPPGTHSRPTAPSPSSANVRPAAPVPMSMTASMHETEDDDDLVLSFLSELSERSGVSDRGSAVGEEERYEQEGIRMPQPRGRVASPPSVSDGEHAYDVRSLDSESAAGSRAISPFVFDVEAETSQAPLVGPSFSVDPASGSASSGAVLDAFSPIHLPHAPGIYGLGSAGSVARSSPPGYESRFVSPMPARSPLTQTSPPRGMSSPRSPRSEAGSAWTSASMEHPEREDARSPARSEVDFEFESVSSVRSSPVHVTRGLAMTTDVEADDESPAMAGARRRVRPRGV